MPRVSLCFFLATHTINRQQACLYFFVLDDFLSLTIHQVTKTIPKIGNPEIKIYGNTARKVDGSKIFINSTTPTKYLICYLLPVNPNYEN